MQNTNVHFVHSTRASAFKCTVKRSILTFSMSVLTLIQLKTKQDSLEQFSAVYRDNPMAVITKTGHSALYVLAHDLKTSMQVTLVFWDSSDARSKVQASDELKAAVVNVKNSGLLLGPPSAQELTIDKDEREPGVSDADLEKHTGSIVVGGAAQGPFLRRLTCRNDKNEKVEIAFLREKDAGALPRHWFVR